MILFDEFCKWAIKKSLDLEDDDNDDAHDSVEEGYESSNPDIEQNSIIDESIKSEIPLPSLKSTPNH